MRTQEAGHRARGRGMLLIASLLLVLIAAAALCIGPVPTPLGDVASALSRYLAGRTGSADALITHIRLPRVLMAGIVGAALAVSGAAMQAVFRNPLAEPGITGVGASSFAVLAIVTGLTSLHPLLMPGGAFVGAIAATLIVQLAGTRSHRSSTGALLRVGIALNSFLGALIAAMIANAPNAEDARSAMFWLNGDLTGCTMRDVALALLPILIGTAGVLLRARELNMLSLGEATAQTSGVAVARASHTVLAFAALATAGAVATTGAISLSRFDMVIFLS